MTLCSIRKLRPKPAPGVHRKLDDAFTRGAQTHTVRVQMAGLRKKIEADSARPRWLVTEPAVGYRLRDRS